MALALPFIGGCQKNETTDRRLKCPVDSVHGSANDITGKWKLVKSDFFSSISKERRIKEYSCHDIIYQFYADGRLTVRSNVEDYAGHISGEYVYEIITESGDQSNTQRYLLKVDNKLHSITLSANEISIDMNPINPLAIYESTQTASFIRIR